MNFGVTETYSKTGYLESADKTPIFYRHYGNGQQKAAVIVVHGFGEHSGRYTHINDRLRQEDFEVFCIDLRGHGHSKGKRGDVKSFTHYEDDILSAINHVKNQIAPSKKVFILAHSMGALLGIRVALRSGKEIDGLVLSAPLLGLKIGMPTWKRLASFAVARVCPGFRLKSEISGDQLSSDRSFAESYDSDPLVLKNLSARALREIIRGYESAYKKASDIESSFLMQIAGADPVCDSDAATKWFESVNKSAVDATLKVYPGFLHELYNEIGREQAINDFVTWLNARA